MTGRASLPAVGLDRDQLMRALEQFRHDDARSEVYLGQPVAIGSGPQGAVGGLRFALGAPTVSDIVFGHHWGPSWQARLARAVDDVQLALEKIDLVVASPTLTG